LALSASLAQAQQKAEEEFLTEIGESNSNLKTQSNLKPQSNLKTQSNVVPEIILPDAVAWPIGYGKSVAGKNTLIKTALQVTTV
jgi:hypothetical protein